MALIMLIILISSVLVLSSILSRQLAVAEEVSSSERAFAAANSGLEKALYALVRENKAEADIIGEGEIQYEGTTGAGEPARYRIERASLGQQADGQVPCVVSTGIFREELRRVTIGVCPPENP